MLETINNTRTSSSRECATSVENMVTECHIDRETKIKETKKIITENPDITENLITVGKRATWWLIVDPRKI